MSQLLILAYTLGGGAIGAGLNQYVTNVGQRRTARAAVINKVSEIETIYASIRWPIGVLTLAAENELHIQLENGLHALEGAALVAGIPRTILSSYVLTCRISDTYSFLKASMTKGERELKVFDSKDFDKQDGIEETRQLTSELAQSTDRIVEAIREKDKAVYFYHDEAVKALSTSLWHPVIVRFGVFRKRREIDALNAGFELDRRETFVLAQDNLAFKNKLIEDFEGLAEKLLADTEEKPSHETDPSNLIGANGSAVEDQIQGGAPGA